MILSILIIPIFIVLFYFSLKSLGLIFFKILSIDNEYSDDVYPLIAFPIIFFLVTILHFFVKLNPVLNLLILILAFIVSIFYFKKKGNKFIFL